MLAENLEAARRQMRQNMQREVLHVLARKPDGL